LFEAVIVVLPVLPPSCFGALWARAGRNHVIQDLSARPLCRTARPGFCNL